MLCLASPGGLTGCGDRSMAEPARAGLEEVHATGYVEPAGELRRLAFAHPGIIAEVLARPAQQVKKGDVLMRQEDAAQRAALSVARAAEATAQAAMTQLLAGSHPDLIARASAAVDAAAAEEAFCRAERTRREGMDARAQSRSDLERARSAQDKAIAEAARAAAELRHLRTVVREEDRKAAAATLAAAQATVQAAQTRLDETTLRAPADGTVLDILRHPGESSHDTAAQPVILLGDLSALQVRAEVDEHHALRLAAGQTAAIFGRGLHQRRIPATVTMVRPLMGPRTVFTRASTERKDLDVIQVLLALPSGTILPPGMEVDVAISAPAEPKAAD
jgi:HlyD family secretion protein